MANSPMNRRPMQPNMSTERILLLRKRILMSSRATHICLRISALILLYAKSDVDIIRGPHPQKTNGTIKNMGKRRETHERSPKGAACISAFGLLVLDVKHWTGNRIDFASVSTDLLPHEADIGDRECREGQGQQTDQVGPDKQQTLSQRQIAAQCADQLCV